VFTMGRNPSFWFWMIMIGATVCALLAVLLQFSSDEMAGPASIVFTLTTFAVSALSGITAKGATLSLLNRVLLVITFITFANSVIQGWLVFLQRTFGEQKKKDKQEDDEQGEAEVKKQDE
ncbi:hypothetical protein PENTCL1PPCAC_13132, partial [Pristionchus entomophagus]